MKRMSPGDVARLDIANLVLTSRMGAQGIPLDLGVLEERIQAMPSKEQAKVRRTLGHVGTQIYPTWHYNGTSHGRWTCRNPSILTFPEEILESFPGLRPIRIPLLEFRVAVTLAGEEELITLCEQGKDLHTEVGAMLGVPRRMAKALNYGLVFKVPLEIMSQLAGVPPEGFTGPIAQWYARYPKFTAYADDLAHRSLSGELFETAILGRKDQQGVVQRVRGDRALTYMTTGTAADVMKIAFHQLWDQEISVRAVIHDEFLVDDDNMGRGQMILEEVMQEWMSDEEPPRRTAWEFLLDE